MHSIWAVARNTLAQALRMKIAVVVILLLLVLLPLMSVVMAGDGTLLGKLQTFTSYGLGLISLLLCILTITVSVFTLSNDIKRQYIFLVITKPIRRWELLVGKLLGLTILNTVLLIVFGAILYSCTLLIPEMTNAPEEQKLEAQAEFFTSRIGIKVQLDEDRIRARASERYDSLKKTGQIPDGMSYSRAMGELIGQETMIARKVDPGQAKEWEFENIHLENPEDPNAMLFVRYKYRALSTPPDEQVFGIWQIGDLRQFKGGGKIQTPVYNYEQSEVIGVFHEFVVPANAIAEDGYLAVRFFNNSAFNRTTIIPEELEVLYKTGTFTENYICAVIMVLIRLVFLSVLGISLTTWLSFPVAILVCLVVFFAGLTNGFILDAIGDLGAVAGIIYSFTIKPLLWLLPRFDGDFNPNGYIVGGRTLRWVFLAMTVTVTLLVKGLLLLLAGMLIFSRREMAKAVT